MLEKKKGCRYLVPVVIIVLIVLSFLGYRFLLLKPYSRFLYGEEKDNFYELDLFNLAFYGSGNAEILVQVDCVGMHQYTFVKRFDFTKFNYVWTSEDFDIGAEVKGNILLTPLPKDRKDCRIISVYSGAFVF